jgi:hypothetical protein
MAIQTIVVWNRQLQQSELDSLEAQSAAMTATGVTDGTRLMINGDIDNRGSLVRVWTTMEAANEWVTFVNTFTPAPENATIKEV